MEQDSTFEKLKMDDNNDKLNLNREAYIHLSSINLET
jgi:hypothetical protein